MKMIEELKPAYQYSVKAARLKTTPNYVKKQLKIFNKICQGKHKKAKIDTKRVMKCYKVLKMMIMPRGVKAGQKMTDVMIGYQWVILFASLCVVRKSNPEKNYFTKILLELPRKNWKTFTSAIIMVLSMVILPDYSKLFSVAPDGSLSREVKGYMEQIIDSSPELRKYHDEERFKILRDEIRYRPKKSVYVPLNYSSSRLDGKEPAVYIIDEVGALPNSYAIEAMSSGQVNLPNPLGFVISTKYPKQNNPFEDEIRYAKRCLDNLIKDESVFALLFEPDEKYIHGDIWMTNDMVIKQANPASLVIPDIFAFIAKKRQEAIEKPSVRSNFLCKHCNIQSTEDAESYIDIKDLKKCVVDHIDWAGRTVYIGVDLSQTDDITSIGMVSIDDDKRILMKAFPFIPTDNIQKKTIAEHLDYQKYIDDGICFSCGDRVIAYDVVEELVFQLEKMYGVKIAKIGYDRWNCVASANRWAEKYDVVEVKQHSSVLHPPTKLLYEKILSGDVEYEESELLEIHFANAKCSRDTNLNKYVNKKKSIEKIDIVMSIIDALCLANADIFETPAVPPENLIQVV